MDKFKELTTGAKLVLGAAVVLFIVSWFNWFEIEGFGGENMWNGIGVLAGLLLIALVVWQGLRLANIELEIGVTPSMITAALAILTLVFVFIRFIDKPGGDLAAEVIDRTVWAWLGLALAIVLVIGSWMNMQATGESLADIRATLSKATGRGASDATTTTAAGTTVATTTAAAGTAEAETAEATEATEEDAAAAADDAGEGEEPPKSP
jgi:hypothetical protein